MALTEVVLVGTVKQSDGDTAAVGSVTVVLNQMLFNSTEDIAIQPKAITQALDGSGHFAIPLVCTDDAATEPTGATYNLTFTFDDGGKDVELVVLFIRDVHLASDGVIIHEAKLPSTEQGTKNAPGVEVDGYDGALAGGDIGGKSSGDGDVLWSSGDGY